MSPPGGRINAPDPTAEGLKEAGRSLMGVGDVLAERQSQDEVSNLSAQMSQANANIRSQLEDQTQKGTLDVSKFNEGVTDQLNDIGSNIQTRAGQQFFQRMSSSIQSSVYESAMTRQAHLAGEKAVGNYQTALNSQSTSVAADPSSFDSALKLHDQTIDSLVATGGLPADKAEELRADGKKVLSISAVKGLMNINPDMAKSALDSGKFDQDINGEVKEQLYGQVDQAKRAKLASDELADRLQKQAAEKKAEAWKQTAFPKILDGTLNNQDITNAPLTFADKEHMINLVHAQAEQKAKSDPTVENNVFMRIVADDTDPNKITDDKQIYDQVGHGLTPEKAIFYANVLQGAKTPEGKLIASQRKMLLDAAKQQLVNANPMLGMKDVNGQMNFAKFNQDLMNQEQQLRKAGKSPLSLYDQNDPNSMWKKINQYVKTPQQIMQGNMDLLKNGTVAPPGSPPHPNVGDVQEYNGDKYKFNGGDPRDQKNWQKVDSGKSASNKYAPAAPNDDIRDFTDMLGFTGPERAKSDAEIAQRHRENRGG